MQGGQYLRGGEQWQPDPLVLLSRVEQVKDFRILPKVLDPEEEGEPVTPTRKVKRTLMCERFRGLVESMYDDSEERLVAEGAGDVLGGS